MCLVINQNGQQSNDIIAHEWICQLNCDCTNWRAWSKTMLSGKSTFFVFSKVPEFLLVTFKLLEIHWAAFFSLFYALFSRKKVCKKPRKSGSYAMLRCFHCWDQQKISFVSHSTRNLKNMPPRKPGFFCIPRKRSVKKRKQMQPNVFLVIWRLQAKIQALLKTQKRSIFHLA